MPQTESNGMNTKVEASKCEDCKISFTDNYAYIEHLKSKEHIKCAMKKKYGKMYLEARAKLDEKNRKEKTEASDKMLQASEKPSKFVEEVPKVIVNVESSVSSSVKDSSNSNDDSDENGIYACEVCDKLCTDYLSYQLHMHGKKHKKTVKKITLLEEMKEQKLLPETNNEPKEETWFDQLFPQSRHISPNLDCKICKKKGLGIEAYKQHCKSESHQKKVSMEELLKGMEKEGLSPAIDHENDGEPFAHCDICNKEFSGPVPYMQHMKSISHSKQELRINQLGKIQDLIISKEEDSKFKCKECGKMFSGPIPFNAHLKSSAHGKMMKKTALTDNLEKNHPELIKTFAGENSDNSDGDNAIQLGCKVCRVAFSGPESANDHFTSPKHKKCMQKKATFKKFKQQQNAGKLLVTWDGEKKAKKPESEDNSDFEEEFDIIKEP